jgi:hypothetical protein
MLTLEPGDLLLHCAILGDPDEESEEKTKEYFTLIKHILSSIPDTLEKKSAQGYTPLQIAVLINRRDVVAYLLSIGAYQRARDRQGRNVIHHLIRTRTSRTDEQLEDIQNMIDLFDKDAIKEMLLERTTTFRGALTPLACLIAQPVRYRKELDIISLLSQYSTGEELEMINGEGDLPLHVVSPPYL